LVASVTLAGWNPSPSFPFHVLAQRTAHIIAFLELTFLVPADVALIFASIDQLALCG
jgi:hypothetical protein